METSNISWVLDMAQRLNMGVHPLEEGRGEVSGEFSHLYEIFDQLITREPLRSSTTTLFRDGHWARAVEQGYKTLNQVVKSKAGLELDGQALMQRSFSEKKPMLLINDLKTLSERDEQIGYQMMLSGVMVGIRNPRARDPDLIDTPLHALELLILANHLLGIVQRSTVSIKA